MSSSARLALGRPRGAVDERVRAARCSRHVCAVKTPLNNALWVGIEKTGGVLGSSEPDRELLDAAALCGHLVAPGSVEGFLAEHRRRLFPEAMFADLFPSGRGRPSIPGEVIATVMVLQSLRGLSDREAARELRTNIAWKVAAGLSLTDEGFDPTVLVYWRNRLRASGRPERIFDTVREVVAETGVLATRTARVLDSTVLDDAVLRQDTVMQLAAQLRKTARLIPQVAGLALSGPSTETTGKPICDWDDPADVEAARSPGWSTPLSRSSKRSKVESSPTSSGMPSGCCGCCAVKTSNRAKTVWLRARRRWTARRPGPRGPGGGLIRYSVVRFAGVAAGTADMGIDWSKLTKRPSWWVASASR